MRECSVSNCTRPARARGLCGKHYQRWAKYGDPLETAWEKGDAEARFFAKVERSPSGCWLWTGWLDKDGYGQFGDPRPIAAHRWAYLHLVGSIADGAQLDHLCRVRRCVNPDHLEPVTCGENIRRGTTGAARAAQQRAKTHCPQGHPYSGPNLYVDPKGYRQCRACNNAQRLAAYHAKKQKQ